jgi:auxin efflux carrier family protein
VAARGILYLLIFQQLGQLVRWSWGYHVLLAPKERYEEDEPVLRIESGQAHYTDHPDQTDPDEPLLRTSLYDSPTIIDPGTLIRGEVDSESGSQTPVTARTYSYSKLSGMDREEGMERNGEEQPASMVGPPVGGRSIMSFPGEEAPRSGLRHSVCQSVSRLTHDLQSRRRRLFGSFPPSVQKGLSRGSTWTIRFLRGLWSFMNPPLWAMLIAIVVASVPSLQRLFFDDGTFIRNSVTRAIGQNGQVAVPLILVVLGANLARNTQPTAEAEDTEDPKEERKLIIASLLARLVLPTIIIAPILALLAKYVPISILDDPIFIVVCFLLTGAPSALQLAQICQINNVYMGAMSTILFQGYVIW